MFHLIILGLGLSLVYTVKDILLEIQNRHNAKVYAEMATKPEYISSTIIHSCEPQCKKNKISA